MSCIVILRTFLIDGVLLYNTYRKSSVIESVIFVTLEEVSISVGILKSSINVIWNAFPVADGFGICWFNWWSLKWIKSPELAAFVEVNFAISAPNHCGINVVRHSGEPFIDFFWIISIQTASIVSPVFWPFKEICFSVFIGESSVNIVGKPCPSFWDWFWVTISDSVFGKFVVFVPSKCVSCAVSGIKNSINLSAFTECIVISQNCWSFSGFCWWTWWSSTNAATCCFSSVKRLNSLI